MNIKIKRAYASATPEDGERYLVDRLWPRGVRKDALALTAWLKDFAPSDALRHWFGACCRKVGFVAVVVVSASFGYAAVARS
jgi:uncharacterized protein YeaO (DUF488 family)